MLRIFFCAILFCSFTHAYQRHIVDDGNRKKVVVNYYENNRWVLEEFLVEENRLQELAFRKTFSKRYLLEQYKYSRYELNTQKVFEDEDISTVTDEVESERIWDVRNQWSEAWMQKYSDWIRDEFNKDFYLKYNIKTDCADVIYSTHWIFARMHGLPMATTMTGSHTLFTQDSMKKEWVKLATHNEWHKDERFLAALNYILRNSFTGTLRIDAYPIAISKNTFREGTIYLTHGHAMII